MSLKKTLKYVFRQVEVFILCVLLFLPKLFLQAPHYVVFPDTSKHIPSPSPLPHNTHTHTHLQTASLFPLGFQLAELVQSSRHFVFGEDFLYSNVFLIEKWKFVEKLLDQMIANQ